MHIKHNIQASIQSRIIQPYIQKNFEKTKHGKRLTQLRNCYAGKRCFFIGNGPSLNVNDLNQIYDNQEISFGFNRIYNIFDDTLWRPTFYISQDEKMLKGCEANVNQMQSITKFVPIQLNWYYNIQIYDAHYFNLQWQPQEENSDFLFSDDIAHKIVVASTVMYTATQIVAYMGFKEIYLIGVDHHFQISQNNKGELIIDNTVKDYFSDKYNTDKENLYIPNVEKSTLTYIAMKKRCDERNIKIYNATRGGKLNVFQRVNFDEIFI